MNARVWRAIDILVSAAGLLLLLPLFAAIAVRIWLEDGRPVFFRQIRVGKNSRPFLIWKFRSMRSGTRGSQITAARDKRVTPTGAWLRKYKLDELPQLLNVLRGDMSLIGPRPEVPEFVDHSDPMWRSVLQVRPGITDAASLVYRDEEAILGACSDPESYYREVLLPAKLELNVLHLQSRCLVRDLYLLVLTVRYSFCPVGFDADHVRQTLYCEAGNRD